MVTTTQHARLLTAKEVADELHVHVGTARELLKTGQIIGTKLSTHWRVKRIELDKFIERGRRT